MSKRLVIDLDACDGCETCGVDCGYFYRPQASDHGGFLLRERATFAVICRRCDRGNIYCAADSQDILHSSVRLLDRSHDFGVPASGGSCPECARGAMLASRVKLPP